MRLGVTVSKYECAELLFWCGESKDAAVLDNYLTISSTTYPLVSGSAIFAFDRILTFHYG